MIKINENPQKESDEYSTLKQQNNIKEKEKIYIEIKYFIIFYLISFILLVVRIIPKIICNFSIFSFPFLETNKILLEEKASNQSKKWILFWSLYASFILIDDIASLFLEIFPFYYLLKFLTFSWLALPNFEGSEYILENYFLDFIKKTKMLFKMNHMNKTITSELDDYINGKSESERLQVS